VTRDQELEATLVKVEQARPVVKVLAVELEPQKLTVTEMV